MRAGGRFRWGAAVGAACQPDGVLTCAVSKGLPLANIAQTMRACLCASATLVFCHPTRSLNCEPCAGAVLGRFGEEPGAVGPGGEGRSTRHAFPD